MKIKTAINLDKELFDKIEKERGLIKRSTYIENILNEKLNDKKKE